MDKNLDRIRELAGMAPVQEDTTVVGTMYQIRDKLTESGLDYNPAKGGYNTPQHGPTYDLDDVQAAIDSHASLGFEYFGGTRPIATDELLRDPSATVPGGDETWGEFLFVNGIFSDEEVQADRLKFGDSIQEAGDKTCSDCGCNTDHPKAGCDCTPELDEAKKPDADGDGIPDWADKDEELDEAAKPDFADIDDDGDTDETAKKAAKDADDEPMTEQQLMREWSNSVYKNYEDRGHIQAQPEGETVDNSLRRYLNAEPHKVQVSESHTPKKLSASYKTFKGK